MLTITEAEEFYTEGYVLKPNVFSPNQVGEMAHLFSQLHTHARRIRKTIAWKAEKGPDVKKDSKGSRFIFSPEQQLKRVLWCGGAEPDLLDYARNLSLLWPVAELLGSREFTHLIHQAHFKLPDDGVSYPWHQDAENRRYGTPAWTDVNGKGSYVQVLIMIDEHTVANGPLSVIPESCQAGYRRHTSRHQLENIVEAGIPILGDPGSVLFLNPYTVHCSRTNTSSQPRRTLVTGFASPGANRREYTGAGLGELISLV